jgi:hypothetical protein
MTSILNRPISFERLALDAGQRRVRMEDQKPRARGGRPGQRRGMLREPVRKGEQLGRVRRPPSDAQIGVLPSEFPLVSPQSPLEALIHEQAEAPPDVGLAPAIVAPVDRDARDVVEQEAAALLGAHQGI